ncbi:carbohydrate-binding module family 18 protein [Parathielavia appendiculata]|uniref:Carbohydrate-binding module family 18 protein n=1 Tax=Parathielavia appendiculata TaxID=2587402 RepID=A0AAN6TQ54_9PEZI|nr:carbohydrate-binding module family 18 protein [Parathielavia appendiculata]
MRTIYVGLAAALCWTGALSASPTAEKRDVDAALSSRRRLLAARHNGRSRYASSGFAELGLRQADPQCGPQAGRCPGDLCCSSYGFCGDSVDHCHPLFDCQTQYGTCGWPRVAPQPTTTSTSTTSARPSITSTSTTTTSRPPTTTTTSSMSTSIRPSTSTTSTIPIPTGALQVTTNGQCGNNTMCIGNPNFGPCCSQFFWCGSSLEYCGAGCRSEFGACLGIPGLPGNPPTNGTTTSTTTSGGGPVITSTTTPPVSTATSTTTTRGATSSTTSAAPSFTLPPGQRSSTDGRCGNGVNCLGSTFGRCCSQFGWCGDGDQFCPYIVGCQPEFGYCDPQ